MKELKVLLIDDHDGFLDSAERFLKTLGWVTVVGRGNDGLQAIEMAERLEPDALLMDLSMPRMGGLQATRAIKAQTNPPFIALVSHYDDAHHREHVVKAGADAFVSKLWYVTEIVPILKQLAQASGEGGDA